MMLKHPGIFMAASILLTYLGEHRTFNGVLMNHLRGDRGLNYIV
ncbi:MAG TPA: hypothetical protein VMM58_06105 [Bacteroidota bacterium]|nr:hypothetical protein [Bacteroidota bacterium]